jgi:membrane protein DedA with SNARE-associated domain
MRVYLLIFAANFSTLFIPLPEEITLLGAGYSARSGVANLWLALLVAWAAIMLGDWLTFFAGKAFLPRLLATRLGQRLIKPDTQAWATALVHKYGARTIVMGRFLVALRGPVYLAIGASNYSSAKFLIINGLVGMAEVGLVVGTGYLLGPSDSHTHHLRIIDAAVVALVLLVTIAIPLLVKRLTKDARAEATTAP